MVFFISLFMVKERSIKMDFVPEVVITIMITRTDQFGTIYAHDARGVSDM